MTQPVLFMMLGYPGAGKTTAAHILQKLTGAVHVWADHERREQFLDPTYSHEENLQLYDLLNDRTNQLLTQGKSVIYDTNFKFAEDRQKLRAMADAAGAQAVVVWLTTDKNLARERATNHRLEGYHTRKLGNMTADDFERLSSNLQEPAPNETVIKLDGRNLSEDKVEKALESL